MPHYQAKVSSKGQLTMPAAVREHFDLKTGDIVDFYIDDNERSVRLLARNKSILRRIADLKVHSPAGRPVTVEEMNEAIRDYLTEKHERISREWNEWREFQEWKKSKAKRRFRNNDLHEGKELP